MSYTSAVVGVAKEILVDSPYTALITLTSVTVLSLLVMSTRRSSARRLPPGPRRFPLLGNLTHLHGDEPLYVKLNALRKEHGDVMYLELGALKMLVVFGHAHVKKVLEDYSDSFKYRPVWLVEIKSLQLSNGKISILTNTMCYKYNINTTCLFL